MVCWCLCMRCKTLISPNYGSPTSPEWDPIDYKVYWSHAFMYELQDKKIEETTNREHCWAAAKPAACAISIDLSGPNLACGSGPVVCAYRLNVIWIDLLCHQCGARNAVISHCRPNFYTLGTRCHPSHPWSMLTCQISFESVYCYTFQGRKTTILRKIWHLESSCSQPPFPMRAKSGMLELTHGLCLRAEFRLDQFILSPSSGKKPKFCCFLVFGVLPVGGESWMWVYNCKPSPIQRYPNGFHAPVASWRNHMHKLVHSKVYRQANWQKTQRFWLPWWQMKSEPQ